MLNDYKDKQSLAYNLFLNDILNDCVTHAYLIDENNYSDSFNMIMGFVKGILCKNRQMDMNNCGNCLLCKRIDDGNYPEIKIISPDGMFIKKQQIIDLQQEFSRAAVEGQKRIYVIRDCEKMRPEAANSMLKFLEEPEASVVAILMTNNINNVLSTIISRCKVIKMNSYNDEKLLIDEDLSQLAIDFISSLETKGIDTIVSVKDIWFSVVSGKDRDKMIVVFDIMIDIYYDMIRLITKSGNIKYENWFGKISEYVKLNSLENLLKKINILIEAKDSIKFNVNSNLLLDSVIVRIGGLSNDCRY